MLTTLDLTLVINILGTYHLYSYITLDLALDINIL